MAYVCDFLWLTHQVFEGLHSQGQQTEVRDWVLLSLGSFIQRFVDFLVVIIALSVASLFLLLLFFLKLDKRCMFINRRNGVRYASGMLTFSD